VFNVIDGAGASIPEVEFWVDGIATGGVVESASDVDSTGVSTPGSYSIQGNMCNGGCTIKFSARVPGSSNGLAITIDKQTVQDLVLDELWIRPKLFADLRRHYIIQDGRADFFIATDSRGALASYERFGRSMEYMLGFTTSNGDSRAPLRPDLTAVRSPLDAMFAISGERLGNFVGGADGFVNYDGTTSNAQRIEDLVPRTASYCMEFYGVNDMIGGSARPGFASQATPPSLDTFRFFGDQLRGFEQAAEKNGCIPLYVMDHQHRSDTSLTSCAGEDGTPINCGTWHDQNWSRVLSAGEPAFATGPVLVQPLRIAAGAVSIDPASLTTGACDTTVTATATGALSTDRVTYAPNADINALTGWTPLSSMRIDAWASSNQVNFQVCNPTGGTVDAAAITLNWSVER